MKKLLNKLSEKLAYLLDEIFAFISVPQCPGCNNFLENPHTLLCDNCRQDFNFTGDGPVCLICNCPESESCSCQTEKQFDIPGLYYWGIYTDTFRNLIHRFKFDGQRKIGDFLTEKAIDVLHDKTQTIEADYIIPVPMLKKDRKIRGFNQTEIIADVVSRRLKIPAVFDLLIKIKKTKLQANLGAKERWKNIEDAFAVDDSNRMKGRSVLLIDDIVTTGATCYYSAKALYLAGAEKVTVFALVGNSGEQSNGNLEKSVSEWEVSR